jgi:molybdopterin adenylyltransferase
MTPSTSGSYGEHLERARDQVVRCGVVTVSDTRTEANDASGKLIRSLLGEAGHSVERYRIVKDDPEAIRAEIAGAVTSVDVVILNGGTGIARRDNTVDVVESLLEKRLPGFGEIFRMLSFEEIGSGAILSRATAGVAGTTLLFSIPGSPNAVALAMRRLIVPELEHLVWELVARHRMG